VSLNGTLEDSLGKGQQKEFRVESLQILGECDPEVCLSRTAIFLRSFSALRPVMSDLPHPEKSSIYGVFAGQLSSASAHRWRFINAASPGSSLASAAWVFRGTAHGPHLHNLASFINEFRFWLEPRVLLRPHPDPDVE
jgi:hypothetical protein